MTSRAPAHADPDAKPVPPLEVKQALDEARMLVLGVQVLLGFQYTALFQSGFASLPAAARQLDAAALGLMLLALILPLSTVPYHLVAARNQESRALLSYTRQRLAQAMLPFALAIGIDMALVGLRLGSEALAIGLGATATLVALLFWYGIRWLRPPGAAPAVRLTWSKRFMIAALPPLKPTPLDRRLDHLLTEARVVLPGVQALLGFQFTAVLTDAFLELPSALRLLHLASLGLMALAMILLMAVPSYHRLVAGGNERPDVERFATVMVLASLPPVSLGLAGDFYIALVRVGVSTGWSLALALFSLAACVALWLVYPLLARR